MDVEVRGKKGICGIWGGTMHSVSVSSDIEVSVTIRKYIWDPRGFGIVVIIDVTLVLLSLSMYENQTIVG